MKIAAAIALCSLLTVSTAQAADGAGKELVDKFFADCDAALSEPATLMTLGDVANGYPAMATVDGNVVSVTVSLNGTNGDFMGIRNLNAHVLPGGNSVDCLMHLDAPSADTQAELRDAASFLAEALIGEGVVKSGGLFGGPAVLTAASDGLARFEMWASPDFPPATTVSVANADRFSVITINRYKAAP